MARTSPGRYALHEFAKNVFDVAIANGKGQPLTADASRPSSVGRHRSRRHGGRDLQDLRRSHRRHVSRHRLDARAHQHPGGADVRARLVRAARSRHVRPAARARPGRWPRSCFRPTDPLVFTAPNIHYLMDSPTDFSAFTLRTFTVDDGQKRSGTAADVPHRAARTTAPKPKPTPSPRTSSASSANRINDLRRAAAVRDQHLHVPERLPAVGERRRHGASQQHVADQLRRAAQPAAAPGPAGHRVARVLPRLEHGAHSVDRASSRSTSKKPT